MCCEITCCVKSEDSIKFPEGYDEASPIYIPNLVGSQNQVSTFKIKMGHYANIGSEEDCRNMTFLKGNVSAIKGVYEFSVLNGGYFKAKESTAEIDVHELTPIAIGRKEGRYVLIIISI